MANSWTLNITAKAFAVSTMWGLLNGGSRVIRLARLGILNNQTAGVTGVACLMEIRKGGTAMTWTSPTAVTPIAHDSTNSGLVSVTAGHSGTLGGTAGLAMRRIFWSSDEPSISTATSDELECFVPLNIIWDAGYGDVDVQKLTIRNLESVILYNTTGAAGLADFWGEFTDSAT